MSQPECLDILFLCIGQGSKQPRPAVAITAAVNAA
jgi:hypothetical protein